MLFRTLKQMSNERPSVISRFLMSQEKSENFETIAGFCLEFFFDFWQVLLYTLFYLFIFFSHFRQVKAHHTGLIVVLLKLLRSYVQKFPYNTIFFSYCHMMDVNRYKYMFIYCVVLQRVCSFIKHLSLCILLFHVNPQ